MVKGFNKGKVVMEYLNPITLEDQFQLKVITFPCQEWCPK